MSKKINEFRMPAEWEPQKSVWIAWPHNKNDWPGLFEKIPNVVGKIIKYLTKDQRIDLLVNNYKSIYTTRINLKSSMVFFRFFLLTKNIGPESLSQSLSVLSL